MPAESFRANFDLIFLFVLEKNIYGENVTSIL